MVIALISASFLKDKTMIRKKETQKIVFSGNVVEIYNCKDSYCAKILFRPGYMNLKIEDSQDFHLGDELELECEVKILKAVPYPGTIDLDLE